MIVRKAFKYRLYPTPHQAERLAWVLRRCQELYNAALYQRREAYRVCGASICYYAQKGELPGIKQERPEYREIGSQVLQDVIQRVEWAFAAFFRRVAAGEKPGYPRFRSRDRYDSFTYSQRGLRAIPPEGPQQRPRDSQPGRIDPCWGLTRSRISCCQAWGVSRKRGAATTADDRCAGRCRQDLDTSHLCEGRHKLLHALLIRRLHDHVEGMCIIDDGLGLDGDAVACGVVRRQVRQEHLPHLGIGGRAALRHVLMLRDKEGHA